MRCDRVEIKTLSHLCKWGREKSVVARYLKNYIFVLDGTEDASKNRHYFPKSLRESDSNDVLARSLRARQTLRANVFYSR